MPIKDIFSLKMTAFKASLTHIPVAVRITQSRQEEVAVEINARLHPTKLGRMNARTAIDVF